MNLLAITTDLLSDLRLLPFSPPVTNVYNPLEYAREPYVQYLSLYAGRPKRPPLVLLLKCIQSDRFTALAVRGVKSAADAYGVGPGRHLVHQNGSSPVSLWLTIVPCSSSKEVAGTGRRTIFPWVNGSLYLPPATEHYSALSSGLSPALL